MYTYCATAPPTRHPPGEAHFLPPSPPLVTTFAAGPLPLNRACGVRIATTGGASHLRGVLRRRPVAVSDAETPARSTTFDSCRQKSMRRHQATRDTRSRHPQRLHHPQAGRRVAQLAYAPTSAAQLQKARSPAAQSKSPCRSVVSQQPDRRRRNSNPFNHFRLVSPKTHEATPRDTRQKPPSPPDSPSIKPTLGPCLPFAVAELGLEAKALPSLNAATVNSASRTASDFCRQMRVPRQNGRATKMSAHVQHPATSIPPKFPHYPPARRRI